MIKLWALKINNANLKKVFSKIGGGSGSLPNQDSNISNINSEAISTTSSHVFEKNILDRFDSVTNTLMEENTSNVLSHPSSIILIEMDLFFFYSLSLKGLLKGLQNW